MRALCDALLVQPSRSDSSMHAVAHVTRPVPCLHMSVPAAPPAVGLTTEPAVLACGPLHFACALNNHAWVYPHNAVDGGFVVQKEFVGSVDGIALTQEFGAVQSDGRVFVHRLPGEHGGGESGLPDAALE